MVVRQNIEPWNGPSANTLSIVAHMAVNVLESDEKQPIAGGLRERR